ncbi:MAG TPA: hypothetical protein VF198_10675 [Vicinamibacterales bacterium]
MLVRPAAACAGGRVEVVGGAFDLTAGLPEVRLGDARARLASARPGRLVVIVPDDAPGGDVPIVVSGRQEAAPVVRLGTLVAEGLHQVDNPVFDAAGRLYVTYSGTRGQQVPVSIFRIDQSGVRESFVTGLVNPTSMTVGPDGQLYVSSRFEGVVYRVDDQGHYEAIVSDVGVACGLAFGPDGTLFVGDRSGTIFRVLPSGQATMLATLPPSMAAFHLAMGPDGRLYVTAPTLTSRDRLYRVHMDGRVETLWVGFGRPQGLAFGPDGALYIADAISGSSGIYRFRPDAPEEPELLVSGANLVGLAFDPTGSLVVASNESAWRIGSI